MLSKLEGWKKNEYLMIMDDHLNFLTKYGITQISPQYSSLNPLDQI